MPATLPNDVTRTVLLFLEDLNTPVSLKVYLLIVNHEWEQISQLSVDPANYVDAFSYAADAAACSILKKLEQLPLGLDKSAAAIEKWWAGERECFYSNERLCRYLPQHRLSGDRESTISDFLSDVRGLITQWIGSHPPDLDEIEGKFGPGSTYSDRGVESTIPHKMSSIPSLTRGALWYLIPWIQTKWGAGVACHFGEVSFVPGNRYATVPKTSRTHRSIGVEPSINVFYQLGLGRVLRKRLRSSTGWDLGKAQEIHRQIARESSVSREFATLDLSNASDTVCHNLVRIVMPPRWLEQLEALRSPKTLIKDNWVVLEKFSSMGNGFTFELETIIFAAMACKQARRHSLIGELGVDVFVFGDDIIVPEILFRPLESILKFAGFTVNPEKSFSGDLPFRESCGGDYFAGQPVRPYYLKDLPSGPEGYVAFANGLSAITRRITLSGGTVGRRAWFSCLNSLPLYVRSCRGPEVLGDIVIHESREENWTVRWRNGIRYIRAFKPDPDKTLVVKFGRFTAEVVLACATYGTGNRREGVIPRDGVQGYRVGWVPFS